MDSVTQFALGSCIGVAVLGRKIGPRRAALTGGVLGTLPDLDVFLTYDDPIESFVRHRGWSHSLFVHAALTPVLGEIVRRLFVALRDDRLITWLAVFLCLTTHALLDAFTIYGTRLFLPLSAEPVSLGSIFIIDPLYTIPLLLAVGWAAFSPTWTSQCGKALTICLGLSTAYLCWTLLAQQIVTAKANDLLASQNIKSEQLIATPTPFNSLFWQVIGIDGDTSFNLYMPVLGKLENSSLYAYRRNLQIRPCSPDDDRIARVAAFSRGFYRILVQDNEVSVADLRMGLSPHYAFRFVLGRLDAEKYVPAPTLKLEGRGNLREDFDWLFANLSGKNVIRPAEAAAKTEPVQYAAFAKKPGSVRAC